MSFVSWSSCCYSPHISALLMAFKWRTHVERVLWPTPQLFPCKWLTPTRRNGVLYSIFLHVSRVGSEHSELCAFLCVSNDLMMIIEHTRHNGVVRSFLLVVSFRRSPSMPSLALRVCCDVPVKHVSCLVIGQSNTSASVEAAATAAAKLPIVEAREKRETCQSRRSAMCCFVLLHTFHGCARACADCNYMCACVYERSFCVARGCHTFAVFEGHQQQKFSAPLSSNSTYSRLRLWRDSGDRATSICCMYYILYGMVMYIIYVVCKRALCVRWYLLRIALKTMKTTSDDDGAWLAAGVCVLSSLIIFWRLLWRRRSGAAAKMMGAVVRSVGHMLM